MLDYVALGILVFAVVTVFYGVIVIHDIPYTIAEKRQHPHSDAIHVAGWISLLTLHVLWPFLWIWATLYRPDRGWGFSKQSSQASVQTDQLEMQISALVARLEALESRAGDDAPAVEGGV